MLDDEIGMHISDVKKHVDIIESKIRIEDKLYSQLVDIFDGSKYCYQSKKNSIIQSKNNSILEAVEIKKKNLDSYKKYIEKMMSKYVSTSNNAIDLINDNYHKRD